MATSKEYMTFLLEQLSDIDGITHRMMMGEYIIYCNGKIAAYVCDSRLLVKTVPAALRLLPHAPLQPPYDGAKDMLLVEDIEDKMFLKKLFDEMYEELPMPKAKKSQKDSNKAY